MATNEDNAPRLICHCISSVAMATPSHTLHKSADEHGYQDNAPKLSCHCISSVAMATPSHASHKSADEHGYEDNAYSYK